MNFFTRRFYLDNPADRSKSRGGEFYVGPFKSFWVSDTNNASFQCDLVINPTTSNDDRGIPLKLNQCQAFREKPESACLEFKTAQPGVWIDITFAQEDSISVGSVAVSLTGKVGIDEGSTHGSIVVPVDFVAPTLIFAANGNRKKGTFQNKGPNSVWVGNNSAAELTNADFQNICEEVIPGASFEWKNTGSLYGLTVTTISKVSRREEA